MSYMVFYSDGIIALYIRYCQLYDSIMRHEEDLCTGQRKIIGEDGKIGR